MDRKNFIRVIGRTAFLGGMAALSLSFLLRDKISTDEQCTDGRFCSSCKRLKNCSKPAALNVRTDER